MKIQSWITGALAALAVVLAALGVLLGAVSNMAADEALYAAQSRAAVAQELGLSSEEEVTAYIGLTEAEQADAAAQIALYMALAPAGQPLEMDILNEREQQHMQDVRGLIRLAQSGHKLCVSLAAALAVAIAWTGAAQRRRHRAVLLGAVCGMGALILAALALMLAMRGVGFARLFVGMHRLLFQNDLWLLNPETDVLIRMMPQTLFEGASAALFAQAAKAFGLVLVMLAAVYGVISGMVHRNLSERKRA